MIPSVSGSLRATAKDWRAQAAALRKFQADDRAANAIDTCAADLEERIRQLELTKVGLTAEEFGQLKGVSAQTVRNWCRQGKVPDAEWHGNEWRIPRDALVNRGRREAA